MHAGQTLFVDFISASLDPTKFPEPETVRLDRPDAAYIHHGWGPHACLGRPIVTVAGAAMLRALGRHCGGGLRRAPGAAGEMKRKLFNGAFPVFLAEDGGAWESFPVGELMVPPPFAMWERVGWADWWWCDSEEGRVRWGVGAGEE